MNYNDIERLLETIEIVPLTCETFDGFWKESKNLFIPYQTEFQTFNSVGFNAMTNLKYDFSEGKPEYEERDILMPESVQIGNYFNSNMMGVSVWFQNKSEGLNELQIWNVNENGLPIKFGFEPNKFLYIAEESGFGTPEFPSEKIFLKL